MKKFSTVAVVATFLSVSAFAGEMNVVGRAGLKYSKLVKQTSTKGYSSFNLDYLHSKFKGAITPSVSYFLGLNLLADSTTKNDAVDGTGPLVDEVFVTKTLMAGTTLDFGKKYVLVGGNEYNHKDTDLYTKSAFWDNTPANQAGLTLSHEIAGQTLMAQYFNGNKNSTDGTSPATTNSQSKFGYAVAWSGNFMNDMIKPMVAYSVVPESATASTSSGTRAFSGKDNYMSAGLQFNLSGGFTVEADYSSLTENDATALKKDLKVNSMVASVSYAADRFSPFVKFISDEKKTGTTKTAKTSAYDIGCNFSEAKGDMVSYHVVYSGSTVKTGLDTAATTLKSSPKSIVVGLTFDASVLK